MRYANIPRNSEIVSLFLLHIPPKQIPSRLRERYPEITVKIVYNVVARFHVEQNGKIRGNRSIDIP